jgi:hypothetical protein
LSASAVLRLIFKPEQLRQRGQKVKLQEQPLQVLAALLERPGELDNSWRLLQFEQYVLRLPTPFPSPKPSRVRVQPETLYDPQGTEF